MFLQKNTYCENNIKVTKFYFILMVLSVLALHLFELKLATCSIKNPIAKENKTNKTMNCQIKIRITKIQDNQYDKGFRGGTAMPSTKKTTHRHGRHR